ncbi:MAG: nucleoside monophosphate kinase [Patescibacteria group bacterium]
MDYVLFGIQGSGKGTQGKILAQKIGAAYFETGGELRRLAKEESELGEKIKSIIEAGKLVPNEVVMEIMENFIKTVAGESKPVIFDGLPRNQHQSDTFEALLQKSGRDYTGLYFELSREEAENRILERRTCSKCKEIFPVFYKGTACEKCGGKLVTRADDNSDSIRTRIEIFYKETLPAIGNWKLRGKMLTIDGSKTIGEVTSEMFSAVKLRFPNNLIS